MTTTTGTSRHASTRLVFIIIFTIVGIDDDGGVLGIVRRRRTLREFLFHGGEINCLRG
jgi:hypothetical protein